MKPLVKITVFCFFILLTSCTSSKKCGCPKFGKIEFKKSNTLEDLAVSESESIIVNLF